MYRQCPTAIIAAREDEALTHGQVLYGLIKPTKDMSQVESTAAMVNVIPKKRIYRMETPEEIDLFLTELMKRPLVLQPSAYIGRGLATINCALCTNEERWIIVVNQSHPKILGRLQAGIDTARAKMARGEPFVIKLSFNAYLKRVYLDNLTQTALDPRFTFIDFEDAEIVIRYPGRFRYSNIVRLENEDISFTFDDLLPSEVTRRTVGAAQSEWKNPALRIVMPDELSRVLPGWDFEMIDPLEGVDDAEQSEEDEEEDVGAVGGESVKPTGRVMGRAQRKAAQAGAQTKHVPVELHVPEPEGPQVLYRGDKSSPAPPYEDLHRGRHGDEHAYERAQVHGLPAGHKPPTADAPYEEMNMRRQQYSHNLGPSGQGSQPQMPSSPHGLHSPRTPNMSQSPRTPNIPNSPRTPNMSQSPRTPNMPHSPRTPNMPHSPHTPNMPHSPHTQDMSRSPHSPNMTNGPRTPNMLPVAQTPNLASGPDRYNQDHVPSPQVRSPKQTYLTDDDDGGFGSRSPRDQHKYDTNFNKSAEQDRYDPSDRYANSSSQPVAPPRRNFPPSSRPGVSPRGLHHHQGSGRSDTSASDSGFGESDESGKLRTDKYNSSYSNQPYNPTKTPYYNHAYQQESPERDRSVVDDIMAKHKAMAAQLHSGQPADSNPRSAGLNKQEFYNDGNYGRELQKWRQNINDLEEACDVPQSDFASTRLRVNSNREEPMDESFI